MTVPVSALRRPVRTSGVLSASAAGVAVCVVTASIGAWIAVGICLSGLAAVAASLSRRRSGGGPAATLGLAAGTAVVLGSFVAAVVLVDSPSVLVETLLGLLGVVAVGLALAPLYGDGSRLLLKAGVAVTFACVLASGLFVEASLLELLVAGAGTIVSFDLGENAIGIGEQLGRRAGSEPIQAVHAVASVAVGAVAVLGCLVVRGVGTPGIPLLSLTLLLVAVLFLAVAIHD